jgi:inner membrane protein
MDPVTHLLVGASFGALFAPPGQRRRAMLVGALLAEAHDLDYLIPHADPVDTFTSHRGFTHSLLLMPGVALVLWLALRRWWAPVREAPWSWLAVVTLALLSHPLLDAMTVYGTQLWWPLQRPPVMHANLFIIDPMLTLPLLAGAIVAWRLRERPRAVWWAGLGVSMATLYVGWTLLAKAHLEAGVRAGLAAQGMGAGRVLTVPTPFNSLLWRIVVMRSDGAQYFEGYYSFLSGRSTPLDPYLSRTELLGPIAGSRAVERLQWFAHGFVKVDAEGGRVVVSDLRMGAEPEYVFRFAVGARRDGAIVALTPSEQLPWPTLDWSRVREIWRRASP